MNLLFWRQDKFPEDLTQILKSRSFSEKRDLKLCFRNLITAKTPNVTIIEVVQILSKLQDYPLPHISVSKEKEIVFTWLNFKNNVHAYLNLQGRLSWLGDFNNVYEGCGEEFWNGNLPPVFKNTMDKLYPKT